MDSTKAYEQIRLVTIMLAVSYAALGVGVVSIVLAGRYALGQLRYMIGELRQDLCHARNQICKLEGEIQLFRSLTNGPKFH
jgi:hypothetical protein